MAIFICLFTNKGGNLKTPSRCVIFKSKRLGEWQTFQFAILRGGWYIQRAYHLLLVTKVDILNLRLTISLSFLWVCLMIPSSFDSIQYVVHTIPKMKKIFGIDDEVLFDQYITMPRGKLLTLLLWSSFFRQQHFLRWKLLIWQQEAWLYKQEKEAWK